MPKVLTTEVIRGSGLLYLDVNGRLYGRSPHEITLTTSLKTGLF